MRNMPIPVSITIMLMFAASLVDAAWSDYEEARDLTLDAGDLHLPESGPGSANVSAVRGQIVRDD